MLIRAILVLLLVLNLGVAAWWMAGSSPEPTPTSAQPVGVARLQLLGETSRASPTTAAVAATDAKAAPAAPVAPSVVEAPAREERCIALGPFASVAAADAARGALQSQLRRARQREQRQTAAKGAWNVAMPSLADRVAAQAMSARLTAAGFTDHYLRNDGVRANAIALGRFGSEDAARRHQQALQAAGFRAEVEPPAASTVYWLDGALAVDTDAEAARKVAGAAQAQSVDCTPLR